MTSDIPSFFPLVSLLFGITVAMPKGDIQYLALEFQICGPLSNQELRKILIDVAHDFLSDINSDSELYSHLKNRSFSISEIGIVLFLIESSFGYV